MAEKMLNTRIALKIDTLENWLSSTLPLKKGELALATVAASAGTALTEPVVMMKVGEDGVKTFKDLEWNMYAKASDVLAACKSEDGLKAFVNNVIASSGLATDSAMTALTGRVTTAEGKITTLEGKMSTAEGKIATNETAIGELEGLVGEKSVSTQISEAIAALDLANTYETKGEAAKVQTALNEYKTSNDAAVQKNATDIAGEIARAKAAEEANAGAITAIKDGTTIDSFKDVEEALAGKQATGDYATKTEAQAMADGKDAAIAEAKKAGTDAAAAASAAQADVDALELLVGDTKVSEQISGAISDLDLANTYAAKAHTHVKDDITDFAHNHEISEVNGLQAALDGKQAAGDYATKTEAQGYADAKDEAIAAAKKAGDDAQAAADKAQEEVDALEALVGTLPEGADVETVVAYVDKKTSGIATDASLSALTDRVTTAEGEIDALQAELDTAETGLKARMTAAEGEIDALQGLVGDTAVATQISTAVATETTNREAADTALGNRVKAIEDDYLTSVEEKELQDQITANANAITLLTNGASAEEVDGVNDLIQYVKDHGTEVTGMKEDISKNADAIAAEKERAEGVEGGLEDRLAAVEGKLGDEGDVADDIAAALSEAKGYTDTEVKKLADGAVATNAADIAALEKLVGDTAVATQISTAVAAEAEIARAAEKANADAIDALEAKAHEHANKAVLDGIEAADITAWDAKVDGVTAAADSGLKATRTGNDIAIEIDDTLTWVFDCGDSSNV